MSTRTTKVYSITMPPEMGRRAEQLARRENRTMSELLRETFRRYEIAEAERRLLADPARVKRLAEFQRLVGELQHEAKRKGLDKVTVREIETEIDSIRKSRSRKKITKQPRT